MARREQPGGQFQQTEENRKVDEEDERMRKRKTTKTKTRVRLENGQKEALRKHHHEHPGMSLQGTIRTKATKIRVEILEDPATPANITSAAVTALKDLVFSNSWLEKFKLRHGLEIRYHHSDAASTNTEAVKRRRVDLQSMTSGYDKPNTFNMDESAYFYCLVPAKSISEKCFPGRKNLKKRLTVALASNVDGSIELPLLFVGAAHRPRSFKGKTGEELG